MSGTPDPSDEAAIDALAAEFYAVFENRDRRATPADALRAMFLPGATITRVGTTGVDTMSVDAFIAPRARMLSDGTLEAFHEWETAARTLVLRDIACRHSTYEKHGRHEDKPYSGGGAKLIQLARTDRVWRIAAIVWEDDA